MSNEDPVVELTIRARRSQFTFESLFKINPVMEETLSDSLHGWIKGHDGHTVTVVGKADFTLREDEQ